MHTRLAPVLICLSLAGCGTYVPSLQEFASDPRSEAQLVQAILTNVKCELRGAIYDFDHPQGYTRMGPTFIDKWGVITNLGLTVSERSAANPTAELLPVSPASAVFTATLGVSGSAEATRTDRIESFITVAELRALNKRGKCDPLLRGGPFLLQSDLKLSHWLTAALVGQSTNVVDFSTFTPKDSVLTHDVKFEIVTSGELTPQWRLVRANINNGGTFLSASRDRTHQLTLTLGPTDETYKPSRQLSNAAQAQAIGNAVATSSRRN